MVLQKVKLGEFEFNKNGKKFHYVLENMTTQSEVDEATEHMIEHFLSREPMCAHIGVKNEPESIASYVKLWRRLTEGTAIAAYLVNDDGSKGKLIGVNMTVISRKDEEEEVFEGDAFNTIWSGVINQSKASNIYEKYGVDEYLTADGLSVHPDYHGCQIGYRILESRRKLCKHLGLGVTGTVFTAGASQHLARKLGYETLSDWDYREFVVDGQLPFFNIPEKFGENRSLFQARKFNFVYKQ